MFNSKTSPGGLSIKKKKKKKKKPEFYRRHFELISNFTAGCILKTLLRKGLSEPEFYCGRVTNLRNL